MRVRRQQSLAGRKGVMYVSLDGGGAESCPTLADSAAVSLSQMAFLSMSVSIFSVGQYTTTAAFNPITEGGAHYAPPYEISL